jgi:two-component system sensor histidine kinase/response regulator
LLPAFLLSASRIASRFISRSALLPVALGLCVAAPATALEQVTVQLKWRHQFQFAGFYAAQDKGYYRDAGLEVTLLEAQRGADYVKSVLSGRAQYGTGNSSLLLHRAAGEPVVVLAAIFQHSAAALFALRPPDGRARQWNGARVMLLPGYEELEAYLLRQGVQQSQLRLMPSTFRIEDLAEGKIDLMPGYITTSPYLLDRTGVRYEILAPRCASSSVTSRPASR